MNTNNTNRFFVALFFVGLFLVLLASSCGSPHYRDNKVQEIDPPEKFEPIPIERPNGVYALVKQTSEHSQIELEAQPSISFNNLRDIKKNFVFDWPVIEIRFKKEDSQKFFELTKANISRQIAIVIENQIVWLPKVMAAIDSGRISFADGYTEDEIDDLIEIIKQGQKKITKYRLVFDSYFACSM